MTYYFEMRVMLVFLVSETAVKFKIKILDLSLNALDLDEKDSF